MQVVFETPDPEAEQLRPVAERRIRLALRRLSWLSPSARVIMSDINGPDGGVDKQCRVELITESTGVVVITSVARNWLTALHSALARAARALLQAWQRNRPSQHTQKTLALQP